MLTGDENILKIMMVVQYRVTKPEDFLFRAEEPHWLVERAVESALNEYVAALLVDDVLTTAKGRIQNDVIDIAQDLLDEWRSGIKLVGGNLQEVSPPVPVLAAFKEVASAKKDSERLIDEAREYGEEKIPRATAEAGGLVTRAEAYRADRVAVAQGDAARFTSLLAEYQKARDVTRTRIYVDAMARILSKAKLVVLGDDAAGPSSVTIVEEAGK
jgi:membrane protease subunit HflK